jgi:Helix-turn-helix domain
VKKSKKRVPLPITPASIAFDPRQRFSINEAAALLRQSRAQIYIDMAAERLRSIKHGKRRYIPGSEILRLSAAPAD